MRSFAPAKLNLCLRVVGRREDGRHLLESLFWPLDWGDELVFRPAKAIGLEVRWAPDAPRTSPLSNDRTNLAWRAAEAAVASGGRPAHLILEKRLPAEAGLGGGSSDAAAVLRELCPGPARAERALALGADVPFFLKPEPGWMLGIGEARDGWDSGGLDLAFVVAVPPFPLATAAVFQHFRQHGNLAEPGARPPARPTPNALAEFLATEGNMLTESALALEPRLAPVVSALRSASPLHSGMSGSGTACFAIFETLSIAKEKAQVLGEEFRSLNCRWIAAGTYRSLPAVPGEHHGNHRGEGLPGQRR